MLALAAPLVLAGPAAAQDVLRVVPQADLQNLDPVWTTAAITHNHAYMVYDVLFAFDNDFQPLPQMVESWEVSDDNLTWSFLLREGLNFSDGSPVTGADAAASIARWAVRMSGGQTMMTRTEEVVATGERSFEIRLNGPFGPMLRTLANPSTTLFIMREQDAMTDPYQQVAEVVGSGPYDFLRDEWEPGSRVAYAKRDAYVPRDEPPDGLAGGKVAKIDRVEWVYIPDANTATQALMAGEVDYYEIPPIDLLPLLRANPDVVVEVVNPVPTQAMLRPNHLAAPMDNPKIRQAMLYVIDQKEYLAAMIGDPELENECWAVFICGTPLETDAGVGDWAQGPDLDRARELLREGGYNGEPIVIMDPTDQQIIHNMTVVTAQKLRDIGMNVDLQAMDWSTLTSRRPVRESPADHQGGWHIFHTWATGMVMGDPLSSTAAPTPCDGSNWFGWACDDELEAIRQEFITASTDEELHDIASRYQAGFYEITNYIPLGEFYTPIAYRANLKGVLHRPAPMLVVWNIEFE